jgi:hypothetical protein
LQRSITAAKTKAIVMARWREGRHEEENSGTGSSLTSSRLPSRFRALPLAFNFGRQLVSGKQKRPDIKKNRIER